MILKTINNLSAVDKYTDLLFKFSHRQVFIFIASIVLIASILGGISYLFCCWLDKKEFKYLKSFLIAGVVSFLTISGIEVVSALTTFDKTKADKLINQVEEVEETYPYTIQISFKNESSKCVYLTNDAKLNDFVDDNKKFVINNNFDEEQSFVNDNIQNDNLFVSQNANDLKLFPTKKSNLITALKENKNDSSIEVKDTKKVFGDKRILEKQMRIKAKLNCIDKNILFKHIREDFCFEDG